MNEGEYKSIVTEVSDWTWGVVQGSFSEQQSISQILVDAAIGMIPVVGDVTAARDLLGISIRLAKHPEKREDKMEWAALVLTGFALLPVAGGAIKGLGKLLLKEAHNATAIGKLIKPAVHVLSHIGSGDAIKFIKELDLMKYADTLKGKLRDLFQRLQVVITTTLRRASWIIPDEMVDVLELVKAGLAKLESLIDKMIPDVLKELNERLKLLQRAMYEGEYLEIPDVLKLKSREPQARLIESITGDTVRKGGVMHFPQNKVTDYEFAGDARWPDLAKHPLAGEWIPGFHGPIRPVVIKKGEKLFRIIDRPGRAGGAWWCRELPPNGRVWREQFAVLEEWNKNRLYVEFIAPTDLYAYEGTVASQLNKARDSRTWGQYLEGGGTQLLIDLQHWSHKNAAAIAERLDVLQTGWRPESHLGVNVPYRTVAVQQLESHELETKVHGAAVITRGQAAQIRGSTEAREEHP